MITAPAGMRIHLALGPTDMRKGFDGLALLAQEVLRADPFSGHLFVFRGKRAGMLRWAIIASLVETAKLNGVKPYAWLRDSLTLMVGGHPASRLDELLPWACYARYP